MKVLLEVHHNRNNNKVNNRLLTHIVVINSHHYIIKINIQSIVKVRSNLKPKITSK